MDLLKKLIDRLNSVHAFILILLIAAGLGAYYIYFSEAEESFPISNGQYTLIEPPKERSDKKLFGRIIDAVAKELDKQVTLSKNIEVLDSFLTSETFTRDKRIRIEIDESRRCYVDMDLRGIAQRGEVVFNNDTLTLYFPKEKFQYRRVF